MEFSLFDKTYLALIENQNVIVVHSGVTFFFIGVPSAHFKIKSKLLLNKQSIQSQPSTPPPSSNTRFVFEVI